MRSNVMTATAILGFAWVAMAQDDQLSPEVKSRLATIDGSGWTYLTATKGAAWALGLPRSPGQVGVLVIVSLLAGCWSSAGS
jgi:hypothetical protein